MKMSGFTDVNDAIEFDESVLKGVCMNLRCIEASVEMFIPDKKLNDKELLEQALKALTLTDLTTLAGDDTRSNVQRMCFRAAYPFPQSHIPEYYDEESRQSLHTAAVCIYPTRVADAYEALNQFKKIGKIQIAAVATGFPSGSYPLETRLKEIDYAIEKGATEIDIVIDRSLVLTQKWRQLYDEIVCMRQICGKRAHMKTILGVGECGTMNNIYKASMVAMMAGADFIKTSTGKEAVNATLPIGLCMIRAIQKFYSMTGRRIGLKPAGGVKTVEDAIDWMQLVDATLGEMWLNPKLFRFGASGLLDDIEKVFYGKKAAAVKTAPKRPTELLY